MIQGGILQTGRVGSLPGIFQAEMVSHRFESLSYLYRVKVYKMSRNLLTVVM